MNLTEQQKKSIAEQLADLRKGELLIAQISQAMYDKSEALIETLKQMDGGPEPEEGDYDTDEEYNKAYEEWEKNIGPFGDYNEDTFTVVCHGRKWCIDNDTLDQPDDELQVESVCDTISLMSYHSTSGDKGILDLSGYVPKPVV